MASGGLEDRVDSAIASYLEVDAAAVAHNVAVFREVLGPGGPALGCVLKADAYGHGLAACLPVFHELTDRIYVIRPEDALAVRAWEAETGARRRPLLVIGAVGAGEAVLLARAGVDVVMGDRSVAGWSEPLRSAGTRLSVHLHIDSGLGREGFTLDELDAAAEVLSSCGDTLELRGVLTHFADTEDVTEQAYAQQQLEVFESAVERVEAWAGRRLERHAAASAAALVLPGSRLDVVRVGISLYGLWPSRESRISALLVRKELPELRPVLSWRCPSQLVKALPEGAFVGYGRTHRCTRATMVAVLPVGYFDGYPRLLSNRAHVLVLGRRCPVLGRVMMNHVVVDVTGVARPGERVLATLLGRDGEESVTADDLADWAQTINYEIVARLGAHLPRRTISEG